MAETNGAGLTRWLLGVLVSVIFLLLGALGAYNRGDISRLEGKVLILETKLDTQRDVAAAQAEARGRMAAQHERILELLRAAQE